MHMPVLDQSRASHHTDMCFQNYSSAGLYDTTQCSMGGSRRREAFHNSVTLSRSFGGLAARFWIPGSAVLLFFIVQ